MSRLAQSTVRHIIEQIDIVDLIARDVNLKIKGAEASGLCPFHNEKSPSFTVSRTKQFFYCFGCHAKGNVIDFTMQKHRYSFIEAITYLAEIYSIQIQFDNQKNNSKELYSILDQASKIYQTQLKNQPHVIEYCKKRQITGTIAKLFSIGYATNNCLDTLKKTLATELIENSGLWSKNQERFRHRLIFPIKNVQGKIIAFGGRSLDNNMQPKYLNSPETPLFHKSKTLYGIQQALLEPLDYWLIVEGYLDVIMCHTYGFTQAVATLGTAFTIEHFKLLERYNKKIIFCFDGDQAGARALDRTMQLLLALANDQHDIKIIKLDPSEDPDSFLRNKGKQAFKEVIDNATSWETYWDEKWSQGLKLDLLADKAKYLHRAQESFKIMPNGYLKQLWIAKIQQQTQTKIHIEHKTPEREIKTTIPIIDCIRWIIESKEYAQTFITAFRDFDTHNPLLEEILEWANNTLEHSIALSNEYAREKNISTYIKQAQTPNLSPAHPLEDCIKWLKKHSLDEKIKLLMKIENKTSEEKKKLIQYLNMKHKL